MNIENELLKILGDENLKHIGESIAGIIREYNLQNSPDICRKLFSYMSEIVDGWNFYKHK